MRHMTDLTLYITWKNYSSWSLRAWLLMRALEIPFEEILVPMTETAALPGMAGISPTRKVPCLIDRSMSGGMAGVTIWETMAIAEYLDELFPDAGVWPEDMASRATARALVSEIHAGFTALRGECPMNLRRVPAPLAVSDACRADVARVGAIFADCLDASGGPFLMGRFSAVDAFYAPVLSRIMTYQLLDSDAVRGFATALDSLPAWQEWRGAALAETAVIPADEVG